MIDYETWGGKGSLAILNYMIRLVLKIAQVSIECTFISSPRMSISCLDPLGTPPIPTGFSRADFNPGADLRARGTRGELEWNEVAHLRAPGLNHPVHLVHLGLAHASTKDGHPKIVPARPAMCFVSFEGSVGTVSPNLATLERFTGQPRKRHDHLIFSTALPR